MNIFKILCLFPFLAVAALAAGAAKPGGGVADKAATRADAIRLVRGNDLSAASAVFETKVAPGQSRDERDIAIAQEWLGIAVYFFNRDEFVPAREALARATEGAAALKQKKGTAGELYWLYRNMGSLTDSLLHDRAQALAYYDLAIQAGSTNPKVAPGEIERLQTKRQKTQETDAAVKARLHQ